MRTGTLRSWHCWHRLFWGGAQFSLGAVLQPSSSPALEAGVHQAWASCHPTVKAVSWCLHSGQSDPSQTLIPFLPLLMVQAEQACCLRPPRVRHGNGKWAKSAAHQWSTGLGRGSLAFEPRDSSDSLAHAPMCLCLRGRRQEDRRFKIILSYTVSSSYPWIHETLSQTKQPDKQEE